MRNSIALFVSIFTAIFVFASCDTANKNSSQLNESPTLMGTAENIPFEKRLNELGYTISITYKNSDPAARKKPLQKHDVTMAAA